MLEGIDYGIDSNPNFSIMFILFNLAVYSNPPLPPYCQVNSFRFNKYLQNQQITEIRQSLSCLSNTPFYPLFTPFFELNRAKSKGRNRGYRLVRR